MPSKKQKDKEKEKEKEKEKKGPTQEQHIRDQITSARAQAQAAGLEVLAKFEEQVKNLTDLAEQYLDQGLLGHHCEALQMRDRAVQTLKETREKLGLPPASPPAAASKGAASVAVAGVGAACAGIAGTGAAGAGAATGAAAGAAAGAVSAKAGKAAKPRAGAGAGAAVGAVAPEELAPDEDAPQPWSTTASGSTPGVPLYRWRPLPSGGAVLQVAPAVRADENEEPEVDVAEGAVRLTWRSAARSLTLPLAFCAEPGSCRAVRRHSEGLRLLELRLPSARPRPPPGASLAESVAGPEGWGVADGFLAGGEAEDLRRHLLDLWRGGEFKPGDLEGGDTANVKHAGANTGGPALVRSDEHIYAQERGPVLAFARRLDRAVLALTSQVPALAGKRLMRGRPMAAVYAGAGARYAPHFDAVGGDNGRVLTCILYLNPFWREGDGAVLRLWPSARRLEREGPCREVAPLHGRLVAFLCDGRNLHEVCPVAAGREPEPRMALSCWYYDAEAIERVSEKDRARDTPEASA